MENTEPPLNKSNKNKKSSIKTWLWGMFFVVLIVFSGYLLMTNIQDKQKIQKLSNPQVASQVESEATIKKLSQMVVLPSDESPTVATVIDYTKLQSQPFFSNAQNGDKALLYAKAKKAFLYRPSINKLVEVATLNINQDSTNGTSAQPTKPANH